MNAPPLGLVMRLNEGALTCRQGDSCCWTTGDRFLAPRKARWLVRETAPCLVAAPPNAPACWMPYCVHCAVWLAGYQAGTGLHAHDGVSIKILHWNGRISTE